MCCEKDEAEHYEGIVDSVLTFEELTNWLKSENIELEPEMDENEHSRARFFPTNGGILKTMAKSAKKYTYMSIDGTDNCIAALKDIESGEIHNCFIEMSACVGSCVGGPGYGKIPPYADKGLCGGCKICRRKGF